MDSTPVSPNRLIWMRRDIERRFGFSGSRYTRVGSLLPALIALAITVAFFGSLVAIGSNPFVDMFISRGWTPPVIVFFAIWSVMILMLKRSKLRLQRRALKLAVMPDEADFVLSVKTVDRVLDQIYRVCDHPKHFVLLHRIEIGLSNIRNLSRVGDLGEILRTQADHDESIMETSFNLIRGLVWAIPILGFIGTVSGLSLAIGGFGRVLSQTDDPSQLIDALKGVTGGLATAFETTLLALIAALLVQMAMTFQKKREEEFLDECTEYCQREVSSRLWSPESQPPERQTAPMTSPVSSPSSSTTSPKKSRRKHAGPKTTATVASASDLSEALPAAPSSAPSNNPNSAANHAAKTAPVKPTAPDPIEVTPLVVEEVDDIDDDDVIDAQVVWD